MFSPWQHDKHVDLLPSQDSYRHLRHGRCEHGREDARSDAEMMRKRPRSSTQVKKQQPHVIATGIAVDVCIYIYIHVRNVIYLHDI